MKKAIKTMSFIGLIFSIVELALFVGLVLTGMGLIVVPTIMGLADNSLVAVFDYVKEGTHGEINETIQQGIVLILFIVLGMLLVDVFIVSAVYFGAVVAMKATFQGKAKFIENSRDSKMAAPLAIFGGLLDLWLFVPGLLTLIPGFMCLGYKNEAEKEALAIARGDKKPAEEAPVMEEEPAEEPVEEEVPETTVMGEVKPTGKKEVKKPLVEEKEESGRKPAPANKPAAKAPAKAPAKKPAAKAPAKKPAAKK